MKQTTLRLFPGVVVVLAVLLAAVAPAAAAAADNEFIVYIGTYTREASKGIYAFRFDAGSGKLTPLGLAAETVNPSFLAIHPNRRYLYAVSEIANFDGTKTGAVSSFRIDAADGKLAFLNQVSSKGAGPCYVAVDKTGRSALVANYGSGSIAAFPLGEDGKLKEAVGFVQHKGSSANPKRQEGPHAHWVGFSPDNKFALAVDLGLDQVRVYRFDAAGATLEANDPEAGRVEPGSGPRHFAFHPNGKFAYVINEMGNTVTVFRWNAARGALTPVQSAKTLPDDFSGTSYTAEVVVHPSGKFLYGSNRGHDSITVFEVDGTKGTLTAVERVSTQGKWPRNFAIDPTGNFLFAANQNSGNVAVFRIDAKTGRLTPSGVSVDVPFPVCVRFVPAR